MFVGSFVFFDKANRNTEQSRGKSALHLLRLLNTLHLLCDFVSKYHTLGSLLVLHHCWGWIRRQSKRDGFSELNIGENLKTI